MSRPALLIVTVAALLARAEGAQTPRCAGCSSKSTAGPLAPIPAQQPGTERDRQAAGAANLADVPALDADRRARLAEALKLKEYERAETILVSAIDEHDPRSHRLLTFLGGLFFVDGKYLNCAIAMKKAEKLGALADGDRFTLAMAYIVLKHPEWARPELEKLAAAHPKSARYPYWLGRLDYDARRYSAAVANFRKALKLDPEYAAVWDNLGLCLDMTGLLDEAVEAYGRAVELNRTKVSPSPWPPLNAGILLLRLDRLEQAEADLREAVRYDAALDKAHYQLGIVLERRGKNEEAVKELKEAARLDPESFAPYLALGRIYRRLGQDAEARRAFDRFRELKKRSRPAP